MSAENSNTVHIGFSDVYGPDDLSLADYDAAADRIGEIVRRAGVFDGAPFTDVEVLLLTDSEHYSCRPEPADKPDPQVLSVVVRVPARWLAIPPHQEKLEMVLLRLTHHLAISLGRASDLLTNALLSLTSIVTDEPAQHRGPLPPLPKDWFGRGAVPKRWQQHDELVLEFRTEGAGDCLPAMHAGSKIAAALEAESLAEYEGEEIGGEEFSVFMWTTAADAALERIRDLLRDLEFASSLVVRVGSVSGESRDVHLSR